MKLCEPKTSETAHYSKRLRGIEPVKKPCIVKGIYGNPLGRRKIIRTFEKNPELIFDSFGFMKKCLNVLNSPRKDYPICPQCEFKFIPIEKGDKMCFKCNFIRK